MGSDELKAQIAAFALDQGADLIGVAPVESYSDYSAQVESRMEETGATLADFMVSPEDTTFFARLDSARNALPTANAIVLIGVYSYDEMAARRGARGELRGKIARTYSYYPVARQVAEKLAAYIRRLGYSAVQGQDVPLKYVADRIGLGRYGKNGLLLTREYGSYVALRDVITDAALAPDAFRSAWPCQDCDLCLRACPTGALYAPYKVNPGLCLNPITRRAASIVPELRVKMRNWICGCDICQEVCPVNRRLTPRKVDPRSGFDPGHHSSHRDLGGLERSPRLLDLLSPDRPEVIRRNAAIALANVGKGSTEAVEALQRQMAGAGDRLGDTLRWAHTRLSKEREDG